MTIYCGRDFSPVDIQTIRELIAQNPKLLRSPLSRRLCELVGWFKPNGELNLNPAVTPYLEAPEAA